MASRGYEGQPVTTDANQFGLPARRRRVYVMLVKVTGNPLLNLAANSLSSQLETFRRLLSLCVRSAPSCAKEVLLDDEDPAIKAELEARLRAKATG